MQLIDENTIIIINKSDQLSPSQKSCKYYLTVDGVKRYVDLVVSAHSEDSSAIQQCLQRMIDRKFRLYEDTSEIYFTRQRYFDKLTNCHASLNAYLHEARPDIACEHLRTAIHDVT